MFFQLMYSLAMLPTAFLLTYVQGGLPGHPLVLRTSSLKAFHIQSGISTSLARVTLQDQAAKAMSLHLA